jgi:7-carboxy-7-deazaguanine synthase
VAVINSAATGVEPVIYPLAKQGVFWTLQGEGALSGEPMAFIRLAGCSVGCPPCDTDYAVHRRIDVDALVQEVCDVVPASFTWPWAWITGGEPTDHDIAPFVTKLREKGFRVALATAGVRDVGRLDLQWISVSPHRAEIAQKNGHELKIVHGLNGLGWKDIAELGRLSFPYKFIQPIWWQTVNGPEMDGKESRIALEACIHFTKWNPGWRLSSQAHKQWGIP